MKSSHIAVPAILVVLLGESFTCPLHAQFSYSTNAGGVTITKYDCSEADVTIPETIDGMPVTGIGNFAFQGCSNLTSLMISKNVTAIGYFAFANCGSLADVTIGTGVATIQSQAFYSCTNLTSIFIPANVTDVSEAAFFGCRALTAIQVDPSNPYCSSADGVLFDKNQTKLIEYPHGKIGEYVIPASVTALGGVAFRGSINLTGVTIPNGISMLGDSSFAFCDSLTNVILSGNITTLGDSAFYQCFRLLNLTLPVTLTSIGRATFANCSNITALYFEGNAPSVASDSFLSDNALTNYYLPGTIGWGATLSSRPTALWVRSKPVILINDSQFGLQTNGFGFTISWAQSANVVVESSQSLSNPFWSSVATQALANGTTHFTDTGWTVDAARFYRAREE